MERFEAIPTMTGAEVYDNVSGRPVDQARSLSQAKRIADRLNRAVGRLKPETASKRLVGEWSS